MIRLVCLAVIVAMPLAAFAEVRCPRVLSEHNADTSDLGRFRQFHKWKDKTGQDLAMAVWQYLCSNETGLYHMNEVLDGTDKSREYSTVRDPLKILNVYNVGYCGIFGPLLDGIFQGVGFEQARAFGVPGWNHCTTEVFYDNAWHYFDLDVRGALMKPDGVIASVREAQQDRSLWVNPVRKPDPFFPNDRNMARVHQIYNKSAIHYDYRWFQAGHSMDFSLRQGESFTRFWRPQGGRWHHLDSYNKTPWLVKLIEREPRGYKSNHRNFSVWTQGNGLWVYQPNLTGKSSDFADGVLSASGLAPAAQGLAIDGSQGHGEAVFEVFSPYIIVPKVNDREKPDDDSEASVVTLEAALPVKVSVTTDNGVTWQEVSTLEPGSKTLDLTKWVKGSYGYWLKLDAQGSKGTLAVRSMKIETWVQVAPTSLPRLMKGVNKCRYEAGDRYGLDTLTTSVTPNLSDPDDLKKHVFGMPTNYTPDKITSRVRGDLIIRYPAPPGRKIRWLTVGAAFTTHQGNAAKNTDNRIAYAVGEPKNFKEIYKADVPTWVNHWKYQWDQDVKLEAPADVVYVKYTGKPAVNVVRATLHCEKAGESGKALRITHGCKVGGRLVERVVKLDKPGDYTVAVDGDPENVFVRMEVVSK